MLIGSWQRLKMLAHSPFLKIDGTPKSQVPSTKSLGIHINENLTWNVRIENLFKKIACVWYWGPEAHPIFCPLQFSGETSF